MAFDRVERRLRRVTAALDAAGLPYAVIGENAVAAWVRRADPGAVRAARDVDLLVRRADLERMTAVLSDLGFAREDLRWLVLFIDRDEPDRRSGVHLVWADELVRPTHLFPAPSVDGAVRDPEGFLVIDLPALVRMKLTAFREIDRDHIADMLGVGLIDDDVRSSLPAELAQRLSEVERAMHDEERA